MVESNSTTQESNWIDIIALKVGITDAQYQEKVTEALATCLQKGKTALFPILYGVFSTD